MVSPFASSVKIPRLLPEAPAWYDTLVPRPVATSEEDLEGVAW